MNDIYVIGNSLAEVYHDSLVLLKENGKIVNCPDYNTTQLECRMSFSISENAMTEPMISKLFPAGPKELRQYELEITEGILDFEVEKGKWHYTYHQRIADQLNFIIDELTRNPYSRRAVIDVRDKESDMGSDNPACLQHIQYFIRDNCLDCCVLFRSNDAVKATFMNAFALIKLQKKIADKLGVHVGSYKHTANSFHCYERDFKTLDRYVDAIWDKEYMESDLPFQSNLVYRYDNDWKELMESFDEEIYQNVKELRKRS